MKYNIIGSIDPPVWRPLFPIHPPDRCSAQRYRYTTHECVHAGDLKLRVRSPSPIASHHREPGQLGGFQRGASALFLASTLMSVGSRSTHIGTVLVHLCVPCHYTGVIRWPESDRTVMPTCDHHPHCTGCTTTLACLFRQWYCEEQAIRFS